MVLAIVFSLETVVSQEKSFLQNDCGGRKTEQEVHKSHSTRERDRELVANKEN